MNNLKFASSFVAIVNEAFVRTFFKGEDPIGERLRVMDSQRDKATEIVGVVRDFRQRDVASPAREDIAQRCWFDFQIVARSQTPPAALIPLVRHAIGEIDAAQLVYLVRGYETVLDNVLAPRRLQLVLLAIFASIALALSSIGLYGVMTYVVTQRTREIGLRLSLGAQKSQVIGLILRKGLGLVLLGLVFGLGGALALTRLMRSLLFEITPTDPLTYIAVPVVLFVVAVAACLLPARRAIRIDPMAALRYE